MTSTTPQMGQKKVTLPVLDKKKTDGEPIVQMAIYDYRSAVIADRIGGIDILCVSDTGGMILFGQETTTSVTFEEMMSMTKAVHRGSKYGLRMVDMPYWSFHVSKGQAVDNAGRFVNEGGAEVMKCEGNQHHVPAIEAIVQAGIPVQGHIGVTPIRIPQLEGSRAQGKTADRAKQLVDDAVAMVEAGCFSILCEVVTEEVTQYLAEILPVPVISLGAGSKADGVHIITSDLLHMYEEHTPRHSKIYFGMIPVYERVFAEYRDEVRERKYPGPEHTVTMKEEERRQFYEMVGRSE